MQPMPAKNRTAVIVGAAILAVVVGGFALWSSRQGADPAPEPMDEYAAVQKQEAAETAPPLTESAEPGSAETGAQSEEPAAAAGAGAFSVPEMHKVAPGETLSSISRKYYGTHIYAGDIEALNKLQEPDALAVGQDLELPKPQALGISSR